MKATLFFSLLVIGVFVSVLSARAWTPPTVSSPDSVVPMPLHTGTGGQEKPGKLSLGGLGVYTSLLIQDGTQGADKILVSDAVGKTSWQDISLFGGGTGLSLTAANLNISLSPETITKQGAISANTSYVQRRITGSCGVGKAISGINADGTVTCRTIPTNLSCYGGGARYDPGFRCTYKVDGTFCAVGSTRYYRKTCGTTGNWVLSSECKISGEFSVYFCQF